MISVHYLSFSSVTINTGRPYVANGTTVSVKATTKSSSNTIFPQTSVTTPATVMSTPSSDFKRTVILIERQTNEGQDLFIRGGFDKDRHQGGSITGRLCHRNNFMLFLTLILSEPKVIILCYQYRARSA